MRRCSRCGEEKSETEFHFKNRERTRRKSYCIPCSQAYGREHYEANRCEYILRVRRNKRQQKANRASLIVQYLEAHPCVDCGETDPLVLEFDHRSDKDFDIGTLFPTRPWETVLAEIEKCDVRCANCHRRRTAQAAGFLRARLLDQS